MKIHLLTEFIILYGKIFSKHFFFFFSFTRENRIPEKLPVFDYDEIQFNNNCIYCMHTLYLIIKHWFRIYVYIVNKPKNSL